jgi:hypothetical protein
LHIEIVEWETSRILKKRKTHESAGAIATLNNQNNSVIPDVKIIAVPLITSKK